VYKARIHTDYIYATLQTMLKTSANLCECSASCQISS